MFLIRRLKENPIIVILVLAALVYTAALVYFVFLEYSHGDLDGRPLTQFPVQGGDSAGYARIAENLIRAGVFSTSSEAPFVPDSFRTPGYPFLVAIARTVFGSNLAVSFLQIVFTLLTGFLIFKMGESLVSKGGGVAAAFLYLFDPTTISHSLFILTDTTFTFLVVLAVFFLFFAGRLVQNRPLEMALLAGAWLGAAILVRPVGMFLPLILAVFYTLLYFKKNGWRKALLGALLFSIASLAVISPWILRNKIVFNTWGLSSIGSTVLVKGNLFEFLQYQRGISAEEARIEMQKLDEEVGYEFGSIKHTAYLQSVFMAHVLRDPLTYFKFHLVKTTPFFLTSSAKNLIDFVAPWHERFSDSGGKPNFTSLLLRGEFRGLLRSLSSQWVFTLENLLWAAVAFFAFSAVILRGWRQPLLILFFVIVASFALITGAVANARYRLPAEPYLFLLAVTGFSVIKEWVFRKKLKKVNNPNYTNRYPNATNYS